MKLGIWTPAPLSLRPDARVAPMFDALTQPGGGVDENYLLACQTIRRAEELGFEITLIAQGFRKPDLDSWMFAASLTSVTKRIEIMAAIHPGIIDPRVVAKMGASLDRISGGRFAINVVNGGRPEEFEAFGIWLDHESARYRRMREFIQIIRGLWTNDGFAIDGEFYKFKRCEVPTRPARLPHPPIYAASRVDEGMDVIAGECDMWFANFHRDPAQYEESVKKVATEIGIMRERATARGRHVGVGLNAGIILGDTDAEAEAKLAEHLAQLARDPSLSSASGGLGAGLIGTPKRVLERMRRYEEIGVDLFLLQFETLPDGLERFAREIMPSLNLNRIAIETPQAARA